MIKMADIDASKSLEEILVLLRDRNCSSSGSRHLLEVGCIVRVFYWWLPRHFGIPNIVPVKLTEPSMLLYIVSVVASPQSLSWIRVQ